VQDGLIAAAGAELARYHGLPSASWLSSDNSSCDAQSVLQKALTGMLHAYHGVNIVWGLGQLETELTLSLEQAVIDDELAAWFYRVQHGIEVSEETIALAVIKEGIREGELLGHEHTLRHFREELPAGKLLAPQRRETWLEEGAHDLVARAHQRVEEILAQPAKPTLSPDKAAKLRAIEAKWMKRIA
jgi:trimethylamine--corrinoid protein Co-methyltransferase